MVNFAGPLQARLAALRTVVVFEKVGESSEVQSKHVMRYFWPGPVVVIFTEGGLSIRRRLELAWSCLFRRDVRGLCYEPPQWARERDQQN